MEHMQLIFSSSSEEGTGSRGLDYERQVGTNDPEDVLFSIR